MNRIISSACALALMSILLCCAEDVAAPSGSDGPFSVYGILNPKLATQTLGVSPVQDLLSEIDMTIDATVTSTELATNKKHAWSDSIVINDLDQIDHVFISKFRPEFDSQHSIEVQRSDGVVSTVDVYIPPRVSIEYEDTGSRYFYVTIRGPRFRINRIDVVYGVRAYNAADEKFGRNSSYTFSFTGERLRTENGWRLKLNLSDHYETMWSLYRHEFPTWQIDGSHVCVGLGLEFLKISLTVGSTDWNPPGGTFDPNVLVQPGTMSNVESGYGFVGGGYDEEAFVYPSAASVEDTWFFDFADDRVPEVSNCLYSFQ